MNLRDALKAVAPAVGHGKIVAQHAFVEYSDGFLRATDGFMFARAKTDDMPGWEFCVRHELLQKALERDDAMVHTAADYGLRVQAQRSRMMLKGTDPEAFPTAVPRDIVWQDSLGPAFRNVLADLVKFTASSDGHIWQTGVHFYPDFAMAANPHALTKCEHGFDINHAFSVPPWAAQFILAQETAPNMIEDRDNYLVFHWNELVLFSTRLIEDPADNIVSFATNLSCERATPVPDNLKETVERVVSYGGTQFRLGDGKLDNISAGQQRIEDIEIEEEVAVESALKIWGTKSMLAALALATEINLSDSPAKWKGGPYTGAFSGISG